MSDLTTVVALCGGCHFYYPAEEAGQECVNDCQRRTRRRREYLCGCEEEYFFPTRKALEEHRQEE